jgi:hypothetical protein
MASQSSREDVGFSNEAEYLELATRAGVESVEEPLEATQASVTGNARTGNWKDGFHYLTQESSLKTALRLPQLIGEQRPLIILYLVVLDIPAEHIIIRYCNIRNDRHRIIYYGRRGY